MFESVINYITPEMSRSDIEKILEKRKEEFRADINKLIDCIKDGYYEQWPSAFFDNWWSATRDNTNHYSG